MKHRTSPQVKALTHIYVRDEQKGYLRPCWASRHTVYCGICFEGVIQPEIGTKCPVCSGTVERILESVNGGESPASAHSGIPRRDGDRKAGLSLAGNEGLKQFPEKGCDGMDEQLLRKKIIREAKRLGAELVGFAPVSRWAEYAELPEQYWPQTIWKPAETVIAVGVPMLLPIVESTPSINHTVLYDTTNTLLDQMAYRLAVFLNNLGHASIFMPRDGYGSLEILLKKMPACFSQVYAGKYAGLGTIGYSHNLLTPRFGPRARYVSVLTSAILQGDPVIGKDLCKGCHICERLCPAQAMSPEPGSKVARLDCVKCTHLHQELLAEKRWPCGVCSKVCFVGEDRKLYGKTSVRPYLNEREAIENDASHPDYKHLVHLRQHGSDGERNY